MAGHSKWANIRHRNGAHGRKRERASRAGGGCVAVRYEGYGPGDSAVLVECLTDNPRRTMTDVRRIFCRYGGNLGADGAVAYLFHPVGVAVYPPGTDEKRVEGVALDAGAEDVITNEDGFIEVLTDPAELETVTATLASAGLTPLDARVTQRACASAVVKGDAARRMVHLLDALDELDDVQNVYSNAQIPSEVLAAV